MTRAELKTMSKQQIKGNIWILFLISLIYTAIPAVFSLIPLVGWIGQITIFPVLELGFVSVFLGLTVGIKPKVVKLFDYLNYIGKALWLYILICVFTLLWSLLFIIPGFVKAYSYSMSFYILAENPEMTALEALNKSKEITMGHKFELFVLELSFILWHILGIITFGIAYIYILPYYFATYANFYKSINPSIEKQETFEYEGTAEPFEIQSPKDEPNYEPDTETEE